MQLCLSLPGNGQIEFAEFVDMMEKFGDFTAEDQKEKDIREAFRIFDRDGDGWAWFFSLQLTHIHAMT